MKKNIIITITCWTLVVISYQPAIFAAKKGKQNEKVVEKKISPQEEQKLELVERIRLVFKFGNAAQVRESLGKLNSLKEEEQKSLIPQMKELLGSSDRSIQISLIQAIGDVKWTDLDSDIVKFLDNEDGQVVTTAANIIHKKNIREALDPLKEKLQKFDYTVSDNHVNDMLNAYASFKDPALQEFMFNKLQDAAVLNTYKVFILKYLGSLEGSQESTKKYLLELFKNEEADLNMRIYAVRALGNLNYFDAREPFKKKLDEIEGLTDLNKKRDLFNLRLELISSLVKLKDEAVKGLLIQMTRDDDELVRIRAIRKLSEFKSGEFTDLLEYKIKYDSSLAVQKEARKALDIIHGKQEEGSNGVP